MKTFKSKATKRENLLHVRQLWAIENWNKWVLECNQKGIDPNAHFENEAQLKKDIQEWDNMYSYEYYTNVL